MTFSNSRQEAGNGETPVSSLRRRIARSVFWVAWSRGGLQILSFVTTLLIAHILVPADYGVMAIAGIWTTSIGMLAEMGLGTALVQFRDLGQEEVDTCFWLTLFLAVLGYFVLYLGAPSIGAWFDVPRLADVLPVLALILPITAVRVVSDSLLRRELHLHRVSQAEIIGSGITLPIMLVSAFAHMGIWTLVIGALAAPAIRTAVTFYFAPWIPKFKVGGPRAGELIRFSIATLGAKVFWVLREDSDVFLLGKVAGDVTVGIYDMAKQLALLPTSRISGVVNILSSPIMAELQTDIILMRAIFFRTLRLTVALTLPASAGLVLVADQAVELLLGPKWLATIPILRLLCVYTAIRAIDILLPPVLLARRRERFLYWYCLALLLILPAASLVGALWNGASGLVIIFTPAYFICMTFMAKETLSELSSGFAELWSQIFPMVLATGAMAAIVALARHFWLGHGPTTVIALTGLVLTGAVSYVAGLLAIRGPIINDALQLLSWLMGGRRART